MGEMLCVCLGLQGPLHGSCLLSLGGTASAMVVHEGTGLRGHGHGAVSPETAFTFGRSQR